MSKAKLYLLFFMSFLFSELCSAIEPILVTENTFKLNGEETLYYGFAAGDQIIFDFKEANGKTVKEVEIVEMPSNTKFQDFKTAEIDNKKIKVESNGLYAFRFKNPIVAGRICKIKIQRIPNDESKISFDTGWHYENVNDTTFIPYTEDSLTGYVDEKYIETVKEIVDTKKYEVQLVDNNIEIRSSGIVIHDNPRQKITLDLPNEKSALYEKKVTSWAFWFCPTDVAEDFWTKNKSIFVKLASTAGGAFGGPLGGFAAGAVTELAIPNSKDTKAPPVNYYITTPKNANLFMNGMEYKNLNSGSGIAACVRFSNRELTEHGNLCLCFYNPNLSQRVRINVKAVAIVEENTYKNVDYERIRQVPQYVTLHKNKYKIKTTKEIRMNEK